MQKCSVADPEPYVFGPPGSAFGLVTSTDPAPDPSIIKQKKKKKLDLPFVRIRIRGIRMFLGLLDPHPD
jgi:hypothetical protein